MTPDQMPISSPIAGDLVLTFAMEVGDLFVSLTPRECKRLKIDSAVESLTRNSRITIADAVDSSYEIQAYDGEAFRITIKPDMDACSMIEPGIWINFAAQKDDSLIAIFPHRNLVFFAAKQEVEEVNALKRFMSDVDFSHTHALSRNFYAWEKMHGVLLTFEFFVETKIKTRLNGSK